MKQGLRIFIWLALFGIAFAFVESSVVVYLRKIYYPDGFKFPMALMDPSLEIVEVFREAATIFMLIIVCIMTGKTILQKFSFFVFSFAIWDIFYYIFLKVLLNWPSSLFTWDLLFLIPTPWIGPVITPVIVAVTMIVFSISTVFIEEKGYTTQIRIHDFIIMAIGCFIIFISFILDFLIQVFVENHNRINISNYIPEKFHWSVFITGELILLIGIFLFLKRSLSKHRVKN